jgi:hypothetical protein
MHIRNRYIWFFLPWIALSSSFAVSILTGLIPHGNQDLSTGGVAAIYLVMFIIGVTTLNDTFRFALGFGVRRIDYLLGTTLMALAISLFIALLLLLLAFIERATGNGWWVGVHFFALPYINDGSSGEQFWVIFATLLQLYVLGFAIGSIYRRFGKPGIWTLLILAVLIIGTLTSLLTALNGWGMLLNWLSQHSAFTYALWLVLPIAISLLISYMLLRKATA